MQKTSIEMAVGIFMLIGIACVGYLTIQLGKMQWLGDNFYALDARFKSAAGLKTGSQVEIAGVQVGRVGSIQFDPKRQMALVQLKIQKNIVLTDDVIASVKTSGLIGDRYIKLTPGGSDLALKPGDQITDTESAIDFEDLISKYVFGKV
jgi:phospholipid/cholesterol/gamma-HCH transport system substrate-binding protein